MSGDFAQLPPVGSKRLLFESRVFQDMFPMAPSNCVLLWKSFRQVGDDGLKGVLDEIRLGNVSETGRRLLNECQFTTFGKEEEERCAYLYAFNKDVERRNRERLQELKQKTGGEIVTMASRDVIEDDQPKPFPWPSDAWPQELQVAVDARVMLLYNVDVERKLANGSRGTVVGFVRRGETEAVEMYGPVQRGEDAEKRVGVTVSFDPVEKGESEVVETIFHCPFVVSKVLRTEDEGEKGDEIVTMTGSESGEESEEEREGETLATRYQFPLRLAWAMTIHKAQGQSCPYLEVNLNGCGMNAGQAYTALSRATSAKTMRVKSFHKVIEQVRADPRVINFLRQLERL